MAKLKSEYKIEKALEEGFRKVFDEMAEFLHDTRIDFKKGGLKRMWRMIDLLAFGYLGFRIVFGFIGWR